MSHDEKVPEGEARCTEHGADAACVRTVHAAERDLGGFVVRRVLPQAKQRAVGPFVFFDHFGPVVVAPGQGMQVRPHPHIGLATVSYLFEGAVEHRDSVGSVQTIEPGAINWMTAGRGISHSERQPDALVGEGLRTHGLQLWLALPKMHEEVEPAFHHHAADSLPSVEVGGGVTARVLIGSAWGATSPVATFAPTLCLDVPLGARASFEVPADYAERGVYVVRGEVLCAGRPHASGDLRVVREGMTPTLTASSDAHVFVVGGAPLDGPRHLWWNFVSSSKIRLEQAKREWAQDAFGEVPGDTEERIPLPDEAPHIELVPSKAGGEWVIFQHGETLGEMTFLQPDEKTIDIVHTGVREALRGGGWARKLVHRGVAYARAHDLKILPHCSYARKVLTTDPGFADVLAEDWESRL
jgi:hypothetical protein